MTEHDGDDGWISREDAWQLWLVFVFMIGLAAYVKLFSGGV